jgi:putative ABC transport system permease protein
MFCIAIKMLSHKKPRCLLTVLGLGVAFFLTAAQTGLLVGWCNTTSAVIRHAGVDVWVMAPQTPAFDYGTAIPRRRLYQVRSTPGVTWAEAMVVTWNYWQRPDGRQVNVLIVGLDDACRGGPWQFRAGSIQAVHQPDTVVVDDLYCELLGVSGIGAESQLLDRRAVVGAVSTGVRTFTTAPFVFTSLQAAIGYDRRYRPDEVTYILARCVNGRSPEEVREAITREVPDVAVLTSRQFARRTMTYWMQETGAGITVVCTALLALLVAAVISSQTLFAITQDHVPDYATLLAIGFGHGRLMVVVLIQSLALGLGGSALGTATFAYASCLSAATPIPLETTPLIYLGVVSVCVGCCLLGSFVSIRSILRMDPVMVFRT